MAFWRGSNNSGEIETQYYCLCCLAGCKRYLNIRKWQCLGLAGGDWLSPTFSNLIFKMNTHVVVKPIVTVVEPIDWGSRSFEGLENNKNNKYLHILFYTKIV